MAQFHTLYHCLSDYFILNNVFIKNVRTFEETFSFKCPRNELQIKIQNENVRIVPSRFHYSECAFSLASN